MNCEHEVMNTQMIDYRASGSTDPGCQRKGKYVVRGRHYCLPHAFHMERLWREHDRIVARIRAIPCGESV